MSWSHLILLFVVMLNATCKKRTATSSDKGSNTSDAVAGGQITSIEVTFPFSSDASYDNGITPGSSVIYSYVQKGSYAQNNPSTLGTVEDLLGSANDRASAIARIESLLLSSEGWLATETIPVCYKYDRRIDPDTGRSIRTCVDTQSYQKAVVIGAEIIGRSGDSTWSCKIGFEGNAGDTCTNDNENIKQQIRTLRKALIDSTYRKDDRVK